MKETLNSGLNTVSRIEIDKDRTIGFMGEDCRVYATPELIRDIEESCRNLLLEHLDEGEDSVGTHISISHLAATPLGMWVDINATIIEVNERMITLEIQCVDPVDTVAKGTHTRFVVDLEKTAQRLRAKMAKVA